MQMEEIKTKICSKCKNLQPITNFNKRSKNSDGLSFWCKNCNHEYYLKHYEKNKIHIKNVTSLWAKNNKIIRKRHRKTFKLNRPEQIKTYNKKYYINNKDKCKYANKVWKLHNPNYFNQRERERRKVDCTFKLLKILSNRYRHFLNGLNKTVHTKELIGCSCDEWKTHLLMQFRDGMSWENHGTVWHIDHIIPLSFFDLTDNTEQKLAFHWGNTQPLFINENLSKHNNVPEHTNFRYLDC